MKSKKIILMVLGFLAIGALTGELEARRGGGGRRGGPRMARAGGGARFAGRHGAGRGRRFAGGRRRGWRGGRGRRGYRHGYGPWRRGYGFGYGPWWGYGLGWPGVTIGAGDDYYDSYATTDYRDNMGYTYWELINETDIPIEVRAIGGNYFRIAPGTRTQIPRGASFSIKVKASDGQRMRFATHDHFVKITQSDRDTLRHNTWNE